MKTASPKSIASLLALVALVFAVDIASLKDEKEMGTNLETSVPNPKPASENIKASKIAQLTATRDSAASDSGSSSRRSELPLRRPAYPDMRAAEVIETQKPTHTITPYDANQMQRKLLARLPEPAEGVAPGSEEHIAEARQSRIQSYLENTIAGAGEQPEKDRSFVSPSKPHPYSELRKAGGIFSLIPAHIGLEAQDEAELIAAYREHKMQLYDSRVLK